MVSKTAAEDLKIIATTLTRMKILKTMSKTITCHNSPWKSWFFRLTDSIKWHRQTAKESKREMDKELTKKRQNWHMKIQIDHQGRFHDSQFLETVMITAIYKKQWKPDIYRSICIFSMFYILFSTILYNRPYAKLGSCPFVDQALFRNNSRPRIIIFRTDLLCHTKRVVNWHVGGVCRFSEGFRFNATWCNLGDLSRISLSMSKTSVFWKRCMLTNAPPSWHGFEICRGKSQVTRRAVFYPIRFSRTSVFETRRAWASNWERRKQIAYPTRDLLTTCLSWRILWNSSKGW